MSDKIYIIPAGVMTDSAARAVGCMPVDLKGSNTPITDAAFDALDRGACGTAYVRNKMAIMERELAFKTEALDEIEMRTKVGADGASDPFTQLHLIRRAVSIARGSKL